RQHSLAWRPRRYKPSLSFCSTPSGTHFPGRYASTPAKTASPRPDRQAFSRISAQVSAWRGRRYDGAVPGAPEPAAKLRVELARLSELNEFAILAIGPEAGREQVRSAFLALTKKYHPARFARESPDTVEIANEVFLVIRKAYATLIDDNRRRTKAE